jgi:hypothetical protein
MSPVEQSRGHVGRAGTVALIGVFVLFGGIGLATLAIGREPSSSLNLGDRTFQGGSTKRLAGAIDRAGPIFYGDVSGRKSRDLILQHLGNNDETGWYAFAASPPDKPRDCTWQWQTEERQFRARCDRNRTAPPNGRGLRQFKVTIGNGRIDVDLNATATTKGAGSTSTTAAPTSTTTG